MRAVESDSVERVFLLKGESRQDRDDVVDVFRLNPLSVSSLTSAYLPGPLARPSLCPCSLGFFVDPFC